MKNFDTVREVATERIVILEKLAEQALDERLARRYSRLMKRISLHYKIPIPKDVKRRLCKRCGALLVPGKNCIVRLVSSKAYIMYRCELCNNENKIRY